MLTWEIRPRGGVIVSLSLTAYLDYAIRPTISTNQLPALVNQATLTAEQSMDLHKILLRWYSAILLATPSPPMSSSSHTSRIKTSQTTRKKASRKGLGRS